MSRIREFNNGTLSELNSTIVTLGPGETFTGVGEDVTEFVEVRVAVFSDVASATDGLNIEYSTDNVNFDHDDSYTVPAGTGKNYGVQRVAQFYRIVYTNGGTIQTVFRLTTIFNRVAGMPSSHRIQDSISDDDDAVLIKAILSGKNPSGTFVNFSSTAGGNFKVSLEEFDDSFNTTPLPVDDMMLFIARNLRPGVTHENKYGKSTDGVQLTPTDIWDRADSTSTQQIWLAPTAARIHTIVSSSAADDGTPEGAGAGAQSIRIFYLPDWDTKEAFEDVVLNGVAGVAMVNAAVVVHRMKVMALGSTFAINVGNITATAAVDATVTAQINAGEGQTLMAIYGVPSVQTAFMTGYDINAHNSGNPANPTETDFTFLINEHPDLNTLAFTNKSNLGTIAVGTAYISKKYLPYKDIPGPAIIKFQAEATITDTEGAAEFDLILVDN